MKGVILAGGLGTRLHPLTKVTNKHLLPIYDRPMIYYPIQRMVDSGIRDILIVTGGNHAGDFLELLGNGSQFGLKHLNYTHQAEPGGIAQALGLAENWVDNEPFCVMLGDNYLEKDFSVLVDSFENDPTGAVVVGYEVENPEWYGVIIQDGAGKVTEIQEKPKKPSTNLIAIGLYMYDEQIWDCIKNLAPSGRGELEITDVNNWYISKGELRMHKYNDWWVDCGESIEGYNLACQKVAELTPNALS